MSSVPASSLHGPALFSEKLQLTVSLVWRLPNPPSLSTICCPHRLHAISGHRLKVPPLLSQKLCEARDWVSRRALEPRTPPACPRHSINTPQANERRAGKEGRLPSVGRKSEEFLGSWSSIREAGKHRTTASEAWPREDTRPSFQVDAGISHVRAAWEWGGQQRDQSKDTGPLSTHSETAYV